MTALPAPSPALAESLARQRDLVERVLAEHLDKGSVWARAVPDAVTPAPDKGQR
ncbi:MAG: hypothetical protein ACR2GH_12690 [Pseudonocardia sp.]